MNKILTKILVSAYDLIPVSTKECEKKILLVFGGVIGDSILLCSALSGFKQLYPEQDGYQITIYTTSGAAVILKAYTTGFEIRVVDFKRLNLDWAYHRQVLSELQSISYEIAINPFPAHSNEADTLILKARAKRKVQLLPEGGYALNTLEWITNSIIKENAFFDINMSELERYTQILKYMGLSDYEEVLPILPQYNRNNSEISLDQKYCILAIGGSTPCKQWPGDRFAQVANHICDKYNLDVLLTGGSGEEHILENIKPFLTKPNMVHSVIGKTSLIDLVEVIRRAELLVGNDSSSVHIAAAVSTAAVCVVGGWDYGRMYPYKVKKLEKGQILPVSISKMMECYGCAKVAIGHTNDNCKECVAAQKPYPCIDVISVKDVLEVVDSVLNNKIGV